MDMPKCKLCGEKHYGTCAENMGEPEPAPRYHRASGQPIKHPLPPTDDDRTKRPVTASVGGNQTKHCPTCRCTRVYGSAAERQRAYRARKQDASGN